ncbi:hypothetical protein Tco_0014751 [Tanacetum coccineum]
MSSMGELTFFLGLQVYDWFPDVFDSSRPDIMFADLPEQEAFSDSDYGGASLDRKSTTGGCQFLGRRLISWQCKKQTIMANSTTEAEYVAAANCFKNPVYHSRTKHIEIRHHFIRDCYEKRLIDVIKIHTDANVADLLTKGFDVTRFNFLVSKQFLVRLANCRTLANGIQELVASVDNKEYTITEASIRSQLQLADATGIINLSDAKIYEGLATLGYVSEGKLTFWKKHFTPQWKFLIHTILHCISPKSGGWNQFGSTIATALICLSSNRVQLRIKVKAQQSQLNPITHLLIQSITHPQPHSSTQTTHHSSPPRSIDRQDTKVPQPQGPTITFVADDATTISVGVETEGAATTTSGLDAGMDSGNIHKSPLRSHEAPLPEGNTSGSVEDSLQLKELMVIVPKMVTKIDSLEKELKEKKQTLGHAVLTLVKKVKSLEVALKRMSKRVILSDSEDEETENRNDFAKRMVDMINQKKKYYAEQKAKAKRDKPMTQAQQRDYMSTFIKNQSSWKMAQLKKLTFEELKVEFEKLMRSIESFMPMGSEERVKRAGVQLEQESSKKQKIAVEDVPVTEEKVEVVKKEEPIKRTGKRKKQKARKGTHADKTAKHEAEEDMEALVKGNDTDSSSGTDIPVSIVPVAIKPPSIANWKIIKLGNKGVYQIIREDGTYITYINFGAMLKSSPCFFKNKELATPEQTATGKEISNPLIADSLLKTIRGDDLLLTRIES